MNTSTNDTVPYPPKNVPPPVFTALNSPPSLHSDWRLRPILSHWEIWGFGFTGLLLWITTIPGAHNGLGTQAMYLWLPITIVGVMINLQVRQMAAHWPDMAGGTANYTSRLYKSPLVARYAAMAYFQGWASLPTISGILLADITHQNLTTLGIDFPVWILKVAFTLVAFIIAFAGTRALSVLHLCFVVPAVGFLLLFCVQGTGWLTFAPTSPGLFPESWGSFNLTEWAKWFFVATYAVYGVETSSSFMADAQKPKSNLLCLKAAACLMPVVFILGSWVVMRLSTGTETYHDNVYQNLLQAALPFWGGLANLMIIFFIASSCLLSCATGCANSPRVVYQLALDGHAAPVFGIASHRNVPGPALILTLAISLIFLLWGDMTRVLMVTGTGYFVIFIFMHLGLWLNRDKPYVRWPWWALAFFVAEVIIFFVGGIAWGWKDFLMGILFPVGVMIVDALIRRFPVGIFNPDWWQKLYGARQYSLVNEGMATQVSLLVLFVCGSAAIGWGLSSLVDGTRGSETGINLFAILILVIAFLGVAAACWTTLPKLALVEDAREQAVAEAHHLFSGAHDAILIINQANIIRLANAAAERLFDQARGLAGGNLGDLLALVPDAHGKFPEQTISRPDGSQRVVDMSIATIAGTGLNERAVLLHDITEHKRIQKENEMFIYSASHDLRSPLVNLLGFSKELGHVREDLRKAVKEHDLAPAVQEKLLRIENSMTDPVRYIQTAVGRLGRIIDSLLRLSRAGRVEYHQQEIDLQKTALRIVDAMKAVIHTKGARIDVKELKPAWGDPDAIEQILGKLIDNALHYLDPSRAGVIEIGMKPEAGNKEAAFHTYYVKDNGMGLPESALPVLFHRFQRFHPDLAVGDGISLVVAHRIVERLGGKLWFESVEGQGSVFFIKLPAAAHTGE